MAAAGWLAGWCCWLKLAGCWLADWLTGESSYWLKLRFNQKTTPGTKFSIKETLRHPMASFATHLEPPPPNFEGTYKKHTSTHIFELHFSGGWDFLIPGMAKNEESRAARSAAPRF